MTRSRHSRRFRQFCGTLFVAHLLGSGVAPLADARLQGAFEPGAVHIESPEDGPCSHAHDHQQCVLCQHLAHGAGQLVTGPAVRVRDEVAPERQTAEDELPPLPSIASPRSRAPPLA